MKYHILKLDEFTDLKAISNLKQSIYCTSIETITKLVNYNNYPIENKRLAITNILNFLNYVDSKIIKKGTKFPIYWENMAKFMTVQHYKAYENILKELKIISPVPYQDGTYYKKGLRTTLFRVFNEYTDSEICLFYMPYTKPKLKLDCKIKLDKKFTDCLVYADIDIESALKDELNYCRVSTVTPEALRYRVNAILRLKFDRYATSGVKVDRIYHSFSNLSKISRKHLHVKGKKFNDIDIKNCQPLLLCALLKKHGFKVDDNYLLDVQKGDFYEKFVHYQRNRDNVKIQLYKNIFFDFKPNAEISLKFKLLYPHVYNALESFKEQSKSMACLLQNLEADIFNSIVPPVSNYYYTLFDSVYFIAPTDAVNLMKILYKKFAKYGLKPALSFNGGTEEDFIKKLEIL